jgi:hypothetical protein
MSEVWADYFGTDHNTARSILSGISEKCLPLQTEEETPPPSSPAGMPKHLVATKADLFCLEQLLDGVFNCGEQLLTMRQQVVFEAIKKHLINYIKGNTLFDVEKESQEDLLGFINGPIKAESRPDRYQIMKKVNEDGRITITLATLDIELQELQKKDVIKRYKVDGKNKYSYSITTIQIDAAVSLPDPSTIVDPVYNGKPVCLINPVTGKEVII